MKKIFLAAIILLFSYLGFAQANLQVQSSAKGLYLTHTVGAKENFYSIGRLYNLPPKEIAAYNSLDMNNGLSIGQTIQIPLSASNFSQTTQSGTPVYYVVGEKEGLYRVSVKHNNVLLTNLRKWNNLNNDGALYTGQKLIVGYLNTNGAPSGNIAGVPAAARPETTAAKPPVRDMPQQPVPAQKQPQPQTVTVPKTQPPVYSNTANPAPVATAKGTGYFKTQFDQQIKKTPLSKDQTATAGIFKTNSGWQDGKYYALIDNVEPGTIIQIINPSNNKAIYAKVLGEMSGIRQNQGLGVRISNAAASALEVSEADKFIVKVNY